MGLLSDLMLVDFGMALSTAVLIADTIKPAYLSRSLVDISPEKSTEPNATLRVDLVWLVDEFLCGGASIEIPMGSDRCPSCHLFGIGYHVLLGLEI